MTTLSIDGSLSERDVQPGPSPWVTCPACGLRYRTIRFHGDTPEPCPACAAVDRERQEQDARVRWEVTA